MLTLQTLFPMQLDYAEKNTPLKPGSGKTCFCRKPVRPEARGERSGRQRRFLFLAPNNLAP